MGKRLICLAFDAGQNRTLEITEEMTFADLRAQYLNNSQKLWIRVGGICFAIENESDCISKYPELFITEQAPSYERPNSFVLASSDRSLQQLELVLTARGLTRISVFLDLNDLTKDVKYFRDFIQRTLELKARVVDFEDSASLQELVETAKKQEIFVEVELSQAIIKKREATLREIVDSEKDYVSDLEQILNLWKPEIEKVDDKQLDSLFEDVEVMLDCHQQFLECLESNLHGFGSEFGPLFLNFSQGFASSLRFIQAFPGVVKLINERKVKKKLGNREFLSYLMAPVQRWPKYLSLINQLLEATPKWHPDYFRLVESRTFVEGFVRKTDRTAALVGQQETLARFDTKNKGLFSFVSDSRRILDVFHVWIVTKTRRPGTLYVCNDVLFLLDDDSNIVFDSVIWQFHFLLLDDPQTVSVSCLNEKYPRNHGKSRKDFVIEFQSIDEKTQVLNLVKETAELWLENENEKRIIHWELVEMTPGAPARTESDAVLYDGKLHVFGGIVNESKTISGDFVVLSPDQKRFKSGESGILGRTEHTLTLFGNKFCLIGGRTRNRKDVPIEVFDPKTEHWTQSKCDKLKTITRHTSVLYKNKIYVFGGRSSSELTNELLVYDPESDTVCEFIVTDKKPPPRCGHSAVVFNDSMIIFGGRTEKDALGDLWVFDFRRMTWTKKGDFPKRCGHKAFVFGDEMLVVGGYTETHTASSASFLLTNEYKMCQVCDFGNVPSDLHSFVGVPGCGVEIFVYGGKEIRMTGPLRSLYRLKLNREWTEQLLKTEMASPVSRYSPQRNSKRPETSPVKFSPQHETETVRSLIFSDSDGDDEKEEFFFEHPPQSSIRKVPLSPLSCSTPPKGSPRREIKLEITETQHQRGTGIPTWSIREVEGSETDDSEQDTLTSPIKVKKPEADDNTASLLLDSFKKAMRDPNSSVSEESDIKSQIDDFLGDYVRSGSPLGARYVVNKPRDSPGSKLTREFSHSSFDGSASPTKSRRKWIPDSIKKHGASPYSPSPGANDRFRLTDREAAHCDRATRVLLSSKTSPLKRPASIEDMTFARRSYGGEDDQPSPSRSHSTKFTFFARD